MQNGIDKVWQVWCLKYAKVHIYALAQTPPHKDYFFVDFYELVKKATNVKFLKKKLLAQQNPAYHYIEESTKSLVIWEHSQDENRNPDFKPRAYARIEFR